MPRGWGFGHPPIFTVWAEVTLMPTTASWRKEWRSVLTRCRDEPRNYSVHPPCPSSRTFSSGPISAISAVIRSSVSRVKASL